MSDCVECRYTN